MNPQIRGPIAVQFGVVACLFFASLLTLCVTLISVVSRNERRVSPGRILAAAGDDLEKRIDPALEIIRPFPGMSPRDWAEADRILSERSRETLRSYRGVLGGYYVSDGRRFLGASNSSAEGSSGGTTAADSGSTAAVSSGPPAAEFDIVETQVDAAIRKRKEIFIVQATPPSAAAIRAAPIVREGRIIGAVWTMTRLADPLFLDRSTRGYGLAAALALGGIALALVLALGLASRLRHEVQERNRLQTMLRRNERLAALGKLVAGVAHEVRNPLAGIRGITQLWKKGIGFGGEAFDHLTNEVDRLEGIVARLLQFSRTDAQELAPGDLNAVVAESARLIEASAHERGIRLELDIDRTIPPMPISPPALLQVLRNLGTNAVQVMPQGGSILMKTRLDPSRGRVFVSVADTGPGLAAEAMDHLFEPFFTTKAEGAGLGLAIAREIAIAHRGELTCHNRDGGGAEFLLALPYDRAAENGACER